MFVRILTVLLPVIMLPSMFYGLMIAGADKELGEMSRVIYFHIPPSWLLVIALLVSFIASIMYLIKENNLFDRIAHRSAELGLLFSIIATVTGSIYAYFAWGSAWNWDPKETTIVVLIILYIAYLALRSSMTNVKLKPKISAVYSIVAFITLPFLMFVIPRITNSLHTDGGGGSSLTAQMRIGIYGMTLGLLILYILLLNLALRIDKKKELSQ